METDQEKPYGFDPKLFVGNHVAYMPGALISRRSIFNEIGKFDTDLRIADDIGWFAALNDHQVPIGIVGEVLIYRRVLHSKLSYVTDITLVHSEILNLLRDSIIRRRNLRQ